MTEFCALEISSVVAKKQAPHTFYLAEKIGFRSVDKHVNSHNNRVRMLVHEEPLHSVMGGV
jgi:hypothetical protein